MGKEARHTSGHWVKWGTRAWVQSSSGCSWLLVCERPSRAAAPQPPCKLCGPYHGNLLLQLIELLLFLFLLATPILRSGGGRRILTPCLKKEGRAQLIRETGWSLFTPDTEDVLPLESGHVLKKIILYYRKGLWGQTGIALMVRVPCRNVRLI